MIHHVAAGSPAEAAHLAVYDHVVRINGQFVDDIDSLRAAIEASLTPQIQLEALRFAHTPARFIQHIRAELGTDDLQRIRYPSHRRAYAFTD